MRLWPDMPISRITTSSRSSGLTPINAAYAPECHAFLQVNLFIQHKSAEHFISGLQPPDIFLLHE